MTPRVKKYNHQIQGLQSKGPFLNIVRLLYKYCDISDVAKFLVDDFLSFDNYLETMFCNHNWAFNLLKETSKTYFTQGKFNGKLFLSKQYSSLFSKICNFSHFEGYDETQDKLCDLLESLGIDVKNKSNSREKNLA